MGFFNSLKGKTQVGTDDLSTDQSRSQYGSGTHDNLSTKEEKRRMFGTSSARNPLSDPYSKSAASKSQQPADSFEPPPGPPPPHHNSKNDDYAPPPGPPPSANPPPYHDWTVIPDTALLPPPPALPEDHSPANNATYESAEAAHDWCARNPPFTPSMPNEVIHTASTSGNLSLVRPSTLAKNAELKQLADGTWSLRTRGRQSDTILFSNLPLYFAAIEHSLHTEREKTVYFETRILSIQDAESGVAVGFAAQPYPAWRLPGWHRASLGVHGDDGRRFVNDSWGGRDFVGAFGVGDVVGIGMRFCVEESGGGGSRKCKTKVWFTRNGREEGGGWEIDEERDAERDEGVDGLQGELDMYPAIGVFGGVEIEVRFRRDDWLWRSS